MSPRWEDQKFDLSDTFNLKYQARFEAGQMDLYFYLNHATPIELSFKCNKLHSCAQYHNIVNCLLLNFETANDAYPRAVCKTWMRHMPA